MYKALYNLSIHLFIGVLHLLSPFNSKIKRMIVGRRKQQLPNFEEIECQGTSRVICVHCASLGEFEQGRSLIEALRREEPSAKIIVTFFSPSGYDIRKSYQGCDGVYYLPFDTKRRVKRFLDIVKPTDFYIIKYEYWYNLLSELHSRGSRIYLVSAIFRERSQFTAKGWRGGNFYRAMLNFFTLIFVQDQASKELLERIGYSRDGGCQVVGDTRFDRVSDLVSSSRSIELVKEFVKGSPLTVICGSTWPEDEALLVELMKVNSDWRFVVAPHEIVDQNIERLIAQSGRVATRYSKSEGSLIEGSTLLVIDVIGLLSSIYQYGEIAYIGGGFGAGIHNTLEAATWGMPIVFGPKYEKFKEARDLIKLESARSVTSLDELVSAFNYYSSNYESCGELSRGYVQGNIGATKAILSAVKSL